VEEWKMGNTPSRQSAARGGLGPFSSAGVPAAGTNEVQTITFGGTGAGATFKLRFKNQLTAAITWSATNNTLRDNVDAALEALAVIGTGGVTTAVGTMVSGIGTLTVTFTGINANQNVPLLIPDAITAALTVSVAQTTAGVPSGMQGAGPGALVVDTTNKDLLINDGDGSSQVWAAVGMRRAKVALGASDAAAGVLDWVNPHAGKVFVYRIIVDVTTKSTGACTVDFGTAATAISNDTLIDGLDVGTAAGTFDNYINHGTNGLAMVPVASGAHVTGTKATGAAAGLVGTAYILYSRA
jgi:hypothetical protein